MSHRFYCPDLVESGSVSLKETEAHHLVHVLRHAAGDLVELFNGQGLVASCRISTVRKRDVELEVLSASRDPLPTVSFTLATAVPKGDRFEWLVEKATELGVSRLIPITTSRSVVDPRDSKLDKLRQAVVTACKQSGRNHLMSIMPVMNWEDLIRTEIPQHRSLLAHPGGVPLSTLSLAQDRPILALVGPEGGFSDDEVAVATASGSIAVQMGKNILRIETAAIALAAKILL